MKAIESYKDLIVWQKSMDLVELIYRVTEGLPARERWGLSDQMRRAAVSIPSNIAEGYGRQSSGNYKQFLATGRGSLFELETQLYICIRLNYIKQNEIEKILDKIVEIGKMLSSLISKIH